MTILHKWRAGLATLAVIAIATGSGVWGTVKTARAAADNQWIHTFASSQNIQMSSMSLSAIGEVFIAGTFHGTVDFDPGSGENLLASGPSDTSFIAKYTPAGALVWAYRLVGSGDVRINDIVVDPMTQVGVVGSFEGSADLDPGAGVFQAVSEGGHDIFLLRLLPDGNLQWAWTEGNGDDDMGFAIATDKTSALYITGKFEGKIHFESGGGPIFDYSGAGGTDIFAARFNNAGTLFWGHALGGGEDDAGTDIGLDDANNVFVVGTFAGEADLDPLFTSTEVRSHGRDDIFVSIMTAFGESRFQTYMGGTGNESNAKITVEPDGAFFLAGEFESSADFDVRGDGGVIESHGGRDIFLTRFGPPNARNFEGAYALGGAGNESVAGITEDAFAGVYLLGSYAQTVDFDLRDGVNEQTSSGETDIFLVKYTRTVDLRQVQSMVNPQDDHASALAVSNSFNVLIGGEYSGTIDLGSGLTVSTGQAGGVVNVFVAQYARDSWTLLPERAYLPGIIADAAAQ